MVNQYKFSMFDHFFVIHIKMNHLPLIQTGWTEYVEDLQFRWWADAQLPQTR